MTMRPNMSTREAVLFESILRCSTDYVEFGCGGSTVLAHSIGSRSIVAVDSSTEWLGKVRSECPSTEKTRLTLIHVDIGPTKQWGFPADESTRARWPDYHTAPWADPTIADADCYLIDGRFRVACMLQTALRCPDHALLLFHDFAPRGCYHSVREVLREIARAEALSVFQKPPNFDRLRTAELLSKFALDPQ
jgi:hypothetical protein